MIVTSDPWEGELYRLALQSRSGAESSGDPLARWLLRRFERAHSCRVPVQLEVSRRPTVWALGRYWRESAQVRVYAVDRDEGPRPRGKVAAIFLHEMAHHLEETEPDSFGAVKSGRVPGSAHGPLFRSILGTLRARWLASAGVASV